MTKFLIGADPEFFLKDTTTGKLVSAHGMIPGTKHDPCPVPGGAVQVDGMALEFNIDPAGTFDEFNNNIESVLTELRKMVDKRYQFVFEPVAHFGKEYIDDQPDEAKMLGCDPDFNAYTSGINPKPNGDTGFRTASGHIHVGWTEGQDITHPDHIEACEMLTQQLDCYLGVPSLLWDTDDTRREMYGQFGAYRPKHYGVEYRVLSNAWVGDYRLRRYVFNQTVNAALALVNSKPMYDRIVARRIYNNYTYSSIMDTITRYIGHLSAEDYNLIQSLGSKLYRKSRPLVKKAEEKWKTGAYGKNVHTYELKHYDEISPVEASNFYFLLQDRYYSYKVAGLSWAQVQEKEAELISKPKKVKLDPQQFITNDTWAPIFQELTEDDLETDDSVELLPQAEF